MSGIADALVPSVSTPATQSTVPLQRAYLGGSLASVVLVSRTRTRTRTRTPWAFEYEYEYEIRGRRRPCFRCMRLVRSSRHTGHTPV
ncbi:MAG: hypothetical protein HZA54_15380 [Planctomycetes bacterium]|nr:hypothetical protein [Planctomycetota bacterium]